MAPAPSSRRPAAAALLTLAAVLALPACKPAVTAQNNSTAPLVVDGNYDDANFVVPDDEGSVEENAAVPGESGNNGAAPRAHDGATHAATHATGAAPR